MPFNSAITGATLTRLRSTTYKPTLIMAVCPNTIVFRAEVNGAPSGYSYASVDFDTVTVGAYTAIEVGQTVYITANGDTDLNNYKFRGRVRATPTSSTLYINETSIVLADNDLITVVDDYDVWQRVPRVVSGVPLIDYDVPFEEIPPTIAGLQSTYIVHTTAGAAVLSFSPTAIAMTNGASISSWLWDIADGTLEPGFALTDQAIDVSFPDGHRWVKVTVTDDNAVSHTFIFEVYVGDALDSATSWVVTGFTGSSGGNNWDEGPNAQLNAHDATGFDRDTILNENRVTLGLLEIFASAATTPINTNILCVGRLISERNSTRADSTYSRMDDSALQVHGMGSLLGALNIGNIAAEDKDTPAVWGDIDEPTPPRVVWHILTRFTTAATLACMDFTSADVTDYVALDLKTDSASALEAINDLGQQINARMVFSHDGALQFKRDAVYQSTSDRAALVTVVDGVGESDLESYNIDITYDQLVGRMIGGGGRYTTSSKSTTGFIAQSPAVSYGEGQETQTINRQILVKNITDAAAVTELGQRTANHLAAINPKPELNVVFVTGAWWTGVPNNGQWWTFTLPATSSTRGVAYTTSTRWVYSGMEWSYAPYRLSVSGSFTEETTDVGASNIVSRIPNVAQTALPVLPPFQAYDDTFAVDATLDYPTDLPTLDDLQPIDGGAFAPYQPIAPEAAADAIDSQPGGECVEVFDVFFTQSTNTASAKLTILNDPYFLVIQGDAQVQETTWTHTFDFTASDGSWATGNASGLAAAGTYVAATGWRYTDTVVGTNRRSVSIEINVGATLTDISMDYTITKGTFTDTSDAALIIGADNTPLQTQSAATTSNGSGTFSWTGAWTTTDVGVAVRCHQAVGAQAGNALITSVTLSGVGANPFGSSVSGVVRSDAFYWKYNSDAGGLAQYVGVGKGLLLDNADVSPIPAFNPQHQYVIPFTGTGNTILARYEDPQGDWSDNQYVPLKIRVCRIVTS